MDQVTQVEDVEEIVVDTDSDEESKREEEQDKVLQEVICERVDLWLENYGSQLFALEYSKADVKERKKQLLLGKSPAKVKLGPAGEQEESKPEVSLAERPAKKRRYL